MSDFQNKPMEGSDVYFDHRLGAAHSKRWLKYAFSKICCAKKLENVEKARKLLQNLAKNCFFKVAPKCWSKVFWEKTLDQHFGANEKKTIFC